MTFQVECRGPEATWRAGRALGSVVAAGDSIGLRGDLGAGKTLLVQGIAAGLGVPETVRVTSPTFTLINDYSGGRLRLYHADLYRIERADELTQLGFEELIGRDAVVAIEWSDRFAVLPADRLDVSLEVAGDDQRILSAVGGGPRSRQLCADWQRALADHA